MGLNHSVKRLDSALTEPMPHPSPSDYPLSGQVPNGWWREGCMRAIVDGHYDQRALNWAFYWESTPQGRKYWKPIKDDGKLTPEIKEQVKELLVFALLTGKLS